VLAAQYYRKAPPTTQHPGRHSNGKFATLLGWLRENIHQHGRKFTAEELTQRITGESIDPKYYMQYLNAKYGEIYGL
jgi:carboxypeptidase Taq